MSTATLSVINLDTRPNAQALFSQEDAVFLVHLALTDLHYMPPFLPTFPLTINRETLRRIRGSLKNLENLYQTAATEIAEAQNRKRLNKASLRCITDIGMTIYDMGFPPHLFSEIIHAITQMKDGIDLDSVIIYTNDTSIPWQWIFNKETHAFLCEEISMGTIFSANPKQFTDVIRQFDVGPPTAPIRPMSTPKALLVGGNMDLAHDPGDKEASDNEIINHHLREIHELLLNPDDFSGDSYFVTDRFANDDVTVISKYFDESNASVDVEERFMRYIVSPLNSRNLKLFHYVGHFGNDILLLDVGKEIGGDQIQQLSFDNQPLIFLNCCQSGISNREKKERNELFSEWSPGSEFSTILLNKNASGVIVTLMPIHSDTHQFAANFYRSLLQQHQRIGTALKTARQMSDQDDPERLFFQLYGDPRNYLAWR